MNSIKRLGVLYGRLGLSTDADLIKRRTDGIVAASEAVQRQHIISLVRIAFRLSKKAGDHEFLQHFSEKDPTFDVVVDDIEASLLAAAILDYEIENNTTLSSIAALAVITAAVEGIRHPVAHESLLNVAQQALAEFQSDALTSPDNRKYNKQPAAFNEAINTVEGINSNYFSHAQPHVINALKSLGKYAEQTALAAAQSDQQILDYVKNLESELRLYWWVSGAWSADAGQPFRKLDTTEAVVRCGKELADKTHNEIGLFSAPALIDMVLERGRSPDKFSDITLKAAAVAGSRSWRQGVFSGAATGPLADILAVSSALGFSAESDDAADWQPRFQRVTGISVDTSLTPVSLGLQIYRERLVAKVFA